MGRPTTSGSGTVRRSLIAAVLALALAILLGSTLNTQTQPASQAADEEAGNKLRRTPHDVHGLILDDDPDELASNVVEAAPGGLRVLTSREIAAPFPFNDVVPSWNVAVPEGAGFSVELRFGRRDGMWTPYYYLGVWGDAPAVESRVTRDDHGEINIDYFQSRRSYDLMQYRLRFKPNTDGAFPKLHRFGLAYSNTLDDAGVAAKFRKPVDPGPEKLWARRLSVPFRSQKWENERIRGSICSPTSTSMVMQYRGVSEPTGQMAALIYDREYAIYGNWARAVQGAFVRGVPGYIERFGDWNAVQGHIAAGQPIIASIRVNRGELSNAPYRASAGHLLVITGFDAAGNVHVNDPAAPTQEAGVTTYARADMEKVWMDRGGVGYVLLAVDDRGR